jgi:hypothetical protein
MRLLLVLLVSVGDSRSSGISSSSSCCSLWAGLLVASCRAHSFKKMLPRHALLPLISDFILLSSVDGPHVFMNLRPTLSPPCENLLYHAPYLDVSPVWRYIVPLILYKLSPTAHVE